MQGKQFYLKTFTTISVISFFCSYLIYYLSTTYIIENVEHLSSIRLYQLKRNAAVNNAGSNRESLFHWHVSNKIPEKYNNNKYQKVKYARKIRRNLLSTNFPDYDLTPEINSLIQNEENLRRSLFLRSLKLNQTRIKSLEQRTREQHLSTLWHIESKKRLLASNFGRACRLYTLPARKTFVNHLLYPKYQYKEEVRYGLKYQKRARMDLARALGKKIKPMGLFVDFEMPYLGASPDGRIGKYGLVEIECPLSARNMTPEDSIRRYTVTFCHLRDGQLYLRRNSNQFYQIQGQLHITRREYCYFCLWTPKGLMYTKILRNETFWEKKMMRQLKKVYWNDLLPALLRYMKA